MTLFVSKLYAMQEYKIFNNTNILWEHTLVIKNIFYTYRYVLKNETILYTISFTFFLWMSVILICTFNKDAGYKNMWHMIKNLVEFNFTLFYIIEECFFLPNSTIIDYCRINLPYLNYKTHAMVDALMSNS